MMMTIFPCEFRPHASLMLHQPSKKGGHLQYFDMEDGEIEQVQDRPKPNKLSS